MRIGAIVLTSILASSLFATEALERIPVFGRTAQAAGGFTDPQSGEEKAAQRSPGPCLVIGQCSTDPRPGEEKAARAAKVASFSDCIKAANLDGYYVVRSADVPASTAMGRSGNGVLDSGSMFLEVSAWVHVAADGTFTKLVAHPPGTFQKGELVHLTVELWPKAPEPTPPGMTVRSAYKHNLTRGQGAFQHESPEQLKLVLLVGLREGQPDLDVPCQALTAVVAKFFGKVDAATAAAWEKKHPEIINGVIIPSVREGMTLAEVEGLFGSPERRAEIGGQTIYFYAKMKVTFTRGKVTRIE